jgi:hypothetical protein
MKPACTGHICGGSSKASGTHPYVISQDWRTLSASRFVRSSKVNKKHRSATVVCMSTLR